MIERKLNWKSWFFILLFAAVVAMFIKAVIMIWSGEVSVGDETYSEPMPSFFAVMITVLGGLVCLTYSVSFINLLLQHFKYGGRAFTIDEKGIHNTLTFVYVFAFAIVVPIKFIPWTSLNKKWSIADDDSAYIRLDTNEVKAGALAKLILKVRGYGFCNGFIRRKFDEDEVRLINNYINK